MIQRTLRVVLRGKDNRLFLLLHSNGLREVRYCGVKEITGYPYPLKLLVKFSVSITTTKLRDSNYSEYQEYLYKRICGYKEDFHTPIGYRKISQIFNEEGLKTPRGSVFKINHVHSIYKKGKIREERINREDVVIITRPIIEVH